MSGQKRGKRAPVLAGEPRVQLLPPWLAEREKNRQARSLAGLVTVLAIVIAGAATGAAYVASLNAEDALKEAQSDTASIQAQQLKYVDGAIAAGNVADVAEAIAVVGATDVLWEEVLMQVQQALPPEAIIDGFTISNRTPWEMRSTTANPLRGETDATLDLIIASPLFLHALGLDQNLKATVPAYADSYVYETSYEGSRGQYGTKVQLTLNVGVLSQRYDQEYREQMLASLAVRNQVSIVATLDTELSRLRAERLALLEGRAPVSWGDHVQTPDGEVVAEPTGTEGEE